MTQGNFEKCHRVAAVIDKFDDLLNMIRSLKKDEIQLLIRSLEKSLEECENK
ncbi:MAG: hypothetical protein ACI4JD_06635 [Ruminococcus sp.]